MKPIRQKQIKLFQKPQLIKKLYLVDHSIDFNSHNYLKRKSKNVFIMSILCASVIMFSISAFCDENVVRNLPTIAFHAGVKNSARNLTDMIAALSISLAAAIIYFYNFSEQCNESMINSNKNLQFQFFRILKGQLSPRSGFLDRSDYLEIVSKAKRLLNLCYLTKWEIILATTLGSAISLTALPNYERGPLFRILVFLVISIPTFLTCNVILYPMAHIYATALSFSIRSSKLKNLAVYVSNSGLSGHNLEFLINHVIQSHNILCKHIAGCNKFWKIYYFFVLICEIPASLFCLHCILFGDLFWFQQPVYVGGFFATLGYVFFVGKILAKLSADVHSIRKAVYRMLLFNKQQIPFKLWVKAMSCLERMSCPNRKIGFSCLTIFTMTYASFAKVSVKN